MMFGGFPKLVNRFYAKSLEEKALYKARKMYWRDIYDDPKTTYSIDLGVDLGEALAIMELTSEELFEAVDLYKEAKEKLESKDHE